MHSSPHDHIVIRKNLISKISFEGSPLIQRGLAELRPRRISNVKLGATLIRQQQHAVGTPFNSATLLLPLQSSEAQELGRHLMDIPSLRLGPATLPAFLEAIAQKNGNHVLGLISDTDKPRSESHNQFARAICSQNPNLEKQLAKSLADSLAHIMGDLSLPGADRRRIVIEDRAGKASLLNFGEPSIKLATKRWQLVAGKGQDSPTRTPMEMPEGWGVAALRIHSDNYSETNSSRKVISLASLSLRMADGQINLDTGRSLKEIAQDWIASELGFKLSDIARLVICDPWLVVARHLASTFNPPTSLSPLTMYPDFIHGWQPIMTAAEFCIHPDVPALAIFSGAFPEVHMMAAWT